MNCRLLLIATKDPRCAFNHATMPVVSKYFLLMPLESSLTFEGSAHATRAFSMVFNTQRPTYSMIGVIGRLVPVYLGGCFDAEAKEFQMRQYRCVDQVALPTLTYFI